MKEDFSSNELTLIKYVAISVVACIAILSATIVTSRAMSNTRELKVREIEAERSVKVRQLEKEEEVIRQAQETERTEERSSFWQKLVPWGEDEAEENSTSIKEK